MRISKLMKKGLVGTLLAAAVAAQVMTAYAAGSASASDNDTYYEESDSSSSSGSSSSTSKAPSTQVTVTNDGAKTSEALSGGKAGSTIGIVVDTTTPSGETIKTNAAGEAVIGDKAVAVAKEEAATAGLPSEAVEQITKVNGGQAISSVIGQVYDLRAVSMKAGERPNLGATVSTQGYKALGAGIAVVTKDAATGAVQDTATEMPLYVPNLLENLGDLCIMFYDNATGQWMILPLTKVDYASKTVFATLPGSGTAYVTYR